MSFKGDFMRIFQSICTASLLLLASASWAQDPVLGQWHTIDDETNEKRKVKRPKRIRPWFYQSASKYYFEIKYGTKSLEIQKNKPTIDVGSKNELLTVIDTIIDATKQGFLDVELKKVTGPIKAKTTS